MKSEKEILRLLEAKEKLYKYLVTQLNIVYEADSEEDITIKQMIEIQSHEIELLDWILK